MRICICDYSGHPFQVQLSRELARRGHKVLHLYFAEFQTPKGRLKVEADDPATLAIESIALGVSFEKYGYIKRRWQEIEVGRRFAKRITNYAPDLVLACNLPLDSLTKVVDSCANSGRPFIFWQQDIYGDAIRKILKRKFGAIGGLIGRYYQMSERRAAARSAEIITIAEDFREILEAEFKIAAANIHVIENWAPLDEITPRAKVNRWSRDYNLTDKKVVLYTGTLGLKHDPQQILALARKIRDRPNASVVITSEGPSANWLAERAKAESIAGLVILPFQPFEVYPDVLGTADVLISILEADAGAFSVPSKILSYMCAGRPIVLAAPPENLASRIVERSGAGLAVPAGNTAKFINAVEVLLNDADLRAECGRRSRNYAAENFDIVKIGDRFESVFKAAMQQ